MPDQLYCDPRPCLVDGCTRFAKTTEMCIMHSRDIRLQSLLTSTSAKPAASVRSADSPKPHRRQPKRSRPPPPKTLCTEPNCTSFARRFGKCSRHGGSIKCTIEGCNTPTQTAGRCRAHGGGTLCKIVGCTSFARFQGQCVGHRHDMRPGAA